MLERLYHYDYRGFEIGLQPQLIVESAQVFSPSYLVRYRCLVRIRPIGSTRGLDTFTLERNSNQPFEDEFEAVAHGREAAEAHIRTELGE
ncbi:hypothetical protein FAZ95_36925 [Trinickia violacea]|uniref:Uncharacterized protein n=1 Tax=Trinickia violacea TaxID=2571746 RepID=A0A4P8J266_9BURK|nr:hypothetical protein [Trinickia violacea]QCP54485.1 hypothetical protein FAZ95_36925 [Trinickia violacea]